MRGIAHIVTHIKVRIYVRFRFVAASPVSGAVRQLTILTVSVGWRTAPGSTIMIMLTYNFQCV